MSDNSVHRDFDHNTTNAHWGDSQIETPKVAFRPAVAKPLQEKGNRQLTALAGLAAVNIETSMAANLSGSLHSLFDDVCDKTLPIYFGPLLGRLYLEGL